jgi:DNA-binding MarR family transcriptional regulator
LVERTSVDGDRRAIRLTITPAGRAALRVAERAMRDRLDAFLADVPDALVVHDALAQLAGALVAQDRANLDTPEDTGVTSQR